MRCTRIVAGPYFNQALRPHHARGQHKTHSKRGLAGPAIAHVAPLLGQDLERCKHFVVFSDLHVSRKSEAACVEVLSYVHAVAARRGPKTGVAFLGDFWHDRGAIPIGPLASVLKELSEWTVPMIMLTGNHDQLTIDGQQHALTPLELALGAAKAKVIDRPTVWRDALWLPYCRDPRTVEKEIARHQMHHERTLNAIFAHVDTIGAQLGGSGATAPTATHGVAPGTFPRDCRVYSGHYHRPHTVAGHPHIRYVGSPYQVTAAEAGQQKSLLLLEASSWQICEEIPIDIGPKFFTLTGWNASPPGDLRPGDHLLWTLPANEQGCKTVQPNGHTAEAMTAAVEEMPAETEAPETADMLRRLGVIVKIKRNTNLVAKPRILHAEDLLPAGLWDSFCQARGVESDLAKAGRRLLAEAFEREAGGGNEGIERQMIFESCGKMFIQGVEMEGYGPFVSKTRYEFMEGNIGEQLNGRGLVLVTGRAEGGGSVDAVSESNGTGKTTLVFSALWAFTGKTRGVGGVGGDVVSDAAKTARVRVWGLKGGICFHVERQVSRSRLLKLELFVDGNDLTTQDARLTQGELNRLLGTDLLGKTNFLDATSVASLLEAGDSVFKEEVGKLVSIEVWQAARDIAALRAREAKTAEATAALAAAESQQRLVRLEQALESQRELEAARIAQQEAQEHDLLLALERRRAAVANVLHRLVAWGVETRATACALSAFAAATAEDVLGKCGDGINHVNKGTDDGIDDVTKTILEQRLQLCVEEASEARIQATKAASAAEAAAEALETFRTACFPTARQEESHYINSDISTGSDRLPSPRCDRCHQPIDSGFAGTRLEQLQQETDLAAAVHTFARERLVAAKVSEGQARVVIERIEHVQAKAQALEVLLERGGAAAARLKCGGAKAWNEGLAGAEARSDRGDVLYKKGVKIFETRLERILSELHDAVVGEAAAAAAVAAAATMAKGRKEVSESDLGGGAGSKIEKIELEALVRSETTTGEIARGERAKAERALSRFNSLEKAFGPRGVQSFLIEGILGALQQRTNTYLSAISDGALALKLSATQEVGKKKKNDVKAETLRERIDKRVVCRFGSGLGGGDQHRRLPVNPSSFVERPLSRISSGERRRVAISMALAFAELSEERSGSGCNLLVLDEVLGGLDADGCRRVCRMLRARCRDAGDGMSTILLTAQAHSETFALFDAADWCVRNEHSGESRVDHGRGEEGSPRWGAVVD